MTEVVGRKRLPLVFSRLLIQSQVGNVLAAHVDRPTNSYLFLGPTGTGKQEWALAFAAALMCHAGGCGTCATCMAVFESYHPDLTLIDNRAGMMPVDVARQIGRRAKLSLNNARHRVLIIHEFDNAWQVAPILLKTIEEPPASTVFVILAKSMTKELSTIASRCVRVEFVALSEVEVAEYLIGNGATPSDAALGAKLCDGNLNKASDLVGDGRVVERYQIWASLVRARFSSGSSLMASVLQIVRFVDSVTEELKLKQATEIRDLKETMKASSASKGIFKDLETDQKRLLRYKRGLEFELGLGTYLYLLRGLLVNDELDANSLGKYVAQCDLVQEALRQINAGVSEQLVLGSVLSSLA